MVLLQLQHSTNVSSQSASPFIVTSVIDLCECFKIVILKLQAVLIFFKQGPQIDEF